MKNTKAAWAAGKSASFTKSSAGFKSHDASPVASAPRPGFKRGGAVKKGSTNVTINIGGKPAGGPPMPPAGLGAPPMLPPGPPMPPPGAMPPGGPGGPALPPGAPPPGMKRGGKVMAGAGSGLGRVQKAKSAKC